MTLRTLNYGNYGMFLIMGSAGFCSKAVVKPSINSEEHSFMTGSSTNSSFHSNPQAPNLQLEILNLEL